MCLNKRIKWNFFDCRLFNRTALCICLSKYFCTPVYIHVRICIIHSTFVTSIQISKGNDVYVHRETHSSSKTQAN